jgi:NADH dehydrogenase/NADH:ubiquinone oxidoreductase subunit G
MIDLKKLLCSILAAMCLAVGHSSAQEPQGQNSGAQSLTLKEAISRATDQSISLAERVAGYEDLLSRSAKERAEAFRVLVASGDETIAAIAARSLLREHSADAAQLISSQVFKWSEANQLAVLQEMQNIGVDESFMQIPREILRRNSLAEASGAKRASSPAATDAAAILLAGSSVAKDRSMLAAALRAQPYSRGLWLAMAAQNSIGASESALAESTYKDAAAPVLVRAAAAAALAAKNQMAADFVANEISSFLSRFAHQKIEKMLTRAYLENEAKANIVSYRQQLRLLGILRFLRTPASELLTFNNLNAENQEIRMTLGLVAAMRWPERLLSVDQGAFSNSEYESLLAVVSLMRPDLTTQVEAKVESGRLNEVQDRVRKYGLVGVFSVPGLVALGG